MMIETERLRLRPWEERDRLPLAAVLGDAEGRRFYPKALSAEEASAQFDSILQRQAEHGVCFGAAELKADGRFVGMVGLGFTSANRSGRSLRGHRRRSRSAGSCTAPVWGQGLTPEAAGRLARLGLCQPAARRDRRLHL